MIVDDLNVISILYAPNEANPPLLVHPDRMLQGSIALKFLQPIARNSPEFVQTFCRMNRKKLLQSASLDIAWQLTAGTSGEKVSRLARCEGLNHPANVTETVTKFNGRCNENRYRTDDDLT